MFFSEELSIENDCCLSSLQGHRMIKYVSCEVKAWVTLGLAFCWKIKESVELHLCNVLFRLFGYSTWECWCLVSRLPLQLTHVLPTTTPSSHCQSRSRLSILQAYLNFLLAVTSDGILVRFHSCKGNDTVYKNQIFVKYLFVAFVSGKKQSILEKSTVQNLRLKYCFI